MVHNTVALNSFAEGTYLSTPIAPKNLPAAQSEGGALGFGGLLLAGIFIVAGPLHFLTPHTYLQIMPPYLSHPLALVYISGAAELLGGIGLLVPSTRRAAAWGLVALLIAVWPANVYMASAHLQYPGLLGQSWAQWVRVLLQIPLIYWAWTYTRRDTADSTKM